MVRRQPCSPGSADSQQWPRLRDPGGDLCTKGERVEIRASRHGDRARPQHRGLPNQGECQGVTTAGANGCRRESADQ